MEQGVIPSEGENSIKKLNIQHRIPTSHPDIFSSSISLVADITLKDDRLSAHLNTDIGSALDAAGRHKALDMLRSLQLKLETPRDTLSGSRDL